MLEIGQVFHKNGYDFCVLDIIDYNMKRYALFSVEQGKIEYLFYEVISSADGYSLNRVDNNALELTLFNIIEKIGV